MRVGRQALTVITPATLTSSWGLDWLSLDEADGATRRRVRDCNIQPKDLSVTLTGVTAKVTGATVYAPAGADVTDVDAIEHDGQMYAVDGAPKKWRSRSGRGRLLLVDLVPWDQLAPFWRHTVTVERLTGQGPSGPQFAPPVPVVGFVHPGNRLVRSSTGDEVVSSAIVSFPLLTEPIPPGSYITPPAALGGRRSRVLTSTALSGAGLDTPDHLEVALA